MATDALHVDRTQSNAMNLQVLKRQDADVMEIVDTASTWSCTSSTRTRRAGFVIMDSEGRLAQR
ncbi:hypothetical protein GQ600_14352 [Phytophthora cactorum]|nr:hypothetical protein GQ600_14352 [Phytophthora cactorum]